MNEATLRRLQQRMEQEGYKEPSDAGSMVDDPAEECTAQQPQSIYTAPTHPSTEVDVDDQYARHMREQERALREFGNNDGVNQVTEQLAQTNLAAAPPPEDSPCASVGEDLWKCDRCGYDSPLMHRFCGLCGGEKPEDWFCFPCQYNNSAYHRFCGLCGDGKPENDLGLGYEDVGLDREDEAAINNTVARMSQHVPMGQQPWEDDDDAYTFAEESCCNTPAQAPQKQQQEEKSTAWSCEICTYVNENPLFMCCEMCGSARPEGAAPQETPLPEVKQQPEGRNTQRRSSNNSVTSSKKKEKRITELMRQQQMDQFKQEGGGAGANQQTLPEPETDHELALIYAQQERILAQYQQQKMQQR